jgi:AbrB family looped-hinge helix DNA binding protein
MAVIKVRDRGQVTIPQEYRDALDLDEDSPLTIVRVGDSLLLTPKRLHVDRLSQQAHALQQQAGISLESILKDLDAQRRQFGRGRHGK